MTKAIALAALDVTERQASRVGKWNCSAWLSPDYRVGMKKIQVQHPEKSQQEIVEEALDLVFAKYGVEPAVPARSSPLRRLFSLGR